MNRQEVLDYIYDSHDTEELESLSGACWDCIKDLRRRASRRLMTEISVGDPVTWKSRRGEVYVATVVQKRKTNVVVMVGEAPPHARFQPGARVIVAAGILELVS